MRTWSAKGLSLHYGDELVALLDFEPCPFTDSWDSLDSLMQFIVDACNAAEAAQEQPDPEDEMLRKNIEAAQTGAAAIRTPVDASKLRFYVDTLDA